MERGSYVPVGASSVATKSGCGLVYPCLRRGCTSSKTENCRNVLDIMSFVFCLILLYYLGRFSENFSDNYLSQSDEPGRRATEKSKQESSWLTLIIIYIFGGWVTFVIVTAIVTWIGVILYMIGFVLLEAFKFCKQTWDDTVLEHTESIANHWPPGDLGEQNEEFVRVDVEPLVQ